MASTKYAVNQMKKAGAEVSDAGFRITKGQFAKASIEITDQDGEAISIYVIRNTAKDDFTTDCFGGHFAENIKRAIKGVLSL